MDKMVFEKYMPTKANVKINNSMFSFFFKLIELF